MAPVQCHNCGEDHFARDCPQENDGANKGKGKGKGKKVQTTICQLCSGAHSALYCPHRPLGTYDRGKGTGKGKGKSDGNGKAARVVIDTGAPKGQGKGKAAWAVGEDKGNGKGAPRGDVGKRFWHSKCCNRNVGPPRFAEAGVINPSCFCGATREQAFEYWTDANGKRLPKGQAQAADAEEAQVEGKKANRRAKRKLKKKNKEVKDFEESDDEDEDEVQQGAQQETEFQSLIRQAQDPKTNPIEMKDILKRLDVLNEERAGANEPGAADEAMEEVNQEKSAREAYKIEAAKLPGFRQQLAGLEDQQAKGEELNQFQIVEMARLNRRIETIEKDGEPFVPRGKKIKALKDAKWKASKAHDAKAKVATDARSEVEAAKQRVLDDTAKIREIELTLATLDHETEVARLASIVAQEAFQIFVDANKKQPAVNGGDAKPPEQRGAGGQAWPQPPEPMDFMTILEAANTEAVSFPSEIRDSYFGSDVGEVQKFLRRLNEASQAAAHFRATSEFRACEGKPYYAELVEDPKISEDSIQTMFGEALAKDDKTGLKKYSAPATAMAKRFREETVETKMSKLKLGTSANADRLFSDARRSESR